MLHKIEKFFDADLVVPPAATGDTFVERRHFRGFNVAAQFVQFAAKLTKGDVPTEWLQRQRKKKEIERKVVVEVSARMVVVGGGWWWLVVVGGGSDGSSSGGSGGG